ncbi:MULTISPECIES: DsbC family protein [unclassified Achromobacter]|uniref:DsbC family protein n=1 Tax=unclassified Achromobacter TaxID=2626865 RepID=UPI000B51C073|nr:MULTISPECIES: DsbC family protein [unclassified Achromobacter]OWT75745.1 disulfide bond formation protein DsbC [Achromobacter sp. HZ28]OWT76405.1 disulfide bond formation protein DsbC [Achromobacter sp. HZ34]
MNLRLWSVAAALAGALALTATVQAQDKAVSTQSAGQPAGPGEKVTGTGQPGAAGDKVYGTDRPAPAGAKVVGTSQMQGATDPAVAEAIKGRFAERFPDMQVTAVRRTPYGLFEVQVGMDLVYTDEDVSWVMEGPLIDAATRRDVTRERQEKLGEVPFDQLPLDLAIKQVRGNGARKVAIFEDPNCGYCKQLRHTLEGQTNLTIYTFLYPILAPDSKTKVRDVWCASNKAATWDDWMLHGKTPPTANCNAPVDKLLTLGQKLMVRGTPTLFFANGSRVSGALPIEELQARLDAK